MKKRVETRAKPASIKEYDFSQGVRGKYASRFPAGVTLIPIAQDNLEVFPDAQSINNALRQLAAIVRPARKRQAA